MGSKPGNKRKGDGEAASKDVNQDAAAVLEDNAKENTEDSVEEQVEETAAEPDGKIAPDGTQSEVEELVRQLVGVMMVNPAVADKIANVLEEFVSGNEVKEESVMGTDGLPGGMQAGAGAQAVAQPPAAVPASASVPSHVPGAALRSRPAQLAMDPRVMERIEMMERSLADNELDRELARVNKRYGEIRGQIGDFLTDKIDEQALLGKVHEILIGKASPFDTALAVYLLEQALTGDGTLRDRILASAAQGVTKPPSVEGRGGGVAASSDVADVGKMSTTELMAHIGKVMAARRGQPGQ